MGGLGGRCSLYVRIDAAEVRRGRNGFRREDWDGGTGEERKLEVVTDSIGHHPLRVLAAAERVLAQEFLCCWDVDFVQATGSGGIAVEIECRLHFGRLQVANARYGEADEIDGDLFVRQCDVASDGSRIGACRTPGASFLGGNAHGTDEDEGQCQAKELALLHLSSMTFAAGLIKCSGGNGQVTGADKTEKWIRAE